MKLQVNELREGMVTSVGTVQEITQHVEDSRVTHYGVRFQDGWECEYPTDVAFKVTAVLGKHVKRGMYLEGYGEVKSVGTYRGYVRIHTDLIGYSALEPAQPYNVTSAYQQPGVDTYKHLLWAIDNKDWAQARAALTELEKQSCA